MKNTINELLNYALQNQMIQKEDIDYSANLLLDVLQEETFQYTYKKCSLRNDEILSKLLVVSVRKGLLKDTITQKDAFDTRIMNCVMPRPSEVVEKFNSLYQKDPQEATQYFYQLSIASNYIRKSRTDKNRQWIYTGNYGNMEITINLSKPEKDPKEIIKEKEVKSSGYPKCLLCKENVGYTGNDNHPARQTHRIVPLLLNNDTYYMQYSPYVYYNEHCIVFNSEHKPMVIDKQTFENIFAFLDILPHYMIGSNADLPIVGGSILSHDHYQGGNYQFPIVHAKTIRSDTFDGINVEMMEWPLSTLRLTHNNKSEMIAICTHILEQWKQYSDKSIGIKAFSGDIRHNTITPIARMHKGKYQIDLVLRNNRCSDEYPLGIFHPHQDVHHIKKENIGLIEVMGLAILPARLKEELEVIKNCLIHKDTFEKHPCLQKHQDWFLHLKEQYIFDENNCDTILKQEVGSIFERVLEDAGVFKMNEEGIQAFQRFMQVVKEGYNDRGN